MCEHVGCVGCPVGVPGIRSCHGVAGSTCEANVWDMAEHSPELPPAVHNSAAAALCLSDVPVDEDDHGLPSERIAALQHRQVGPQPLHDVERRRGLCGPDAPRCSNLWRNGTRNGETAFCAKRGVLMRAGRLPHACRRLHGYTWRSGKTTSLPQANPPHSRAPAPARAKAPMICTPRPSGRTEGLCAIHPPLPCEQLASSTVDHRYQPYRAGVPVPYPRGGLTPPPLPPARPTVTCIRVRTGDDEPYMPAVGLETTTSPSTSKVYILNG